MSDVLDLYFDLEFFNIYMYAYAFMAFTCFILKNGLDNKQSRFIICVICFILLTTLQGLRHINFAGVDSAVYAGEFFRISRYQWTFSQIFTVFYKDFGFYLFAKFISLFTSNFNVFLFICAFVYNFAVSCLIYKYSDNIFLSFTMFFCLGFWIHNFQLVRHCFALSIVIFAVIQLMEGNDKNFFILAGIAATFHVSSILILAIYPIKNIEPGFMQVLWLLLGLYIVFNGKALLENLFSLTLGLRSSRFMSYVMKVKDINLGSWRNNVVKFGILTTISYYAFTRKNRPKSDYFNHSGGNINVNLVFNLGVIGLVCYFGHAIIGEAYRMAQFFSIFTLILVPASLKIIKDKELRFLLTACIVVFSLKFFQSLLSQSLEGHSYMYYPYRFFWEGVQLIR